MTGIEISRTSRHDVAETGRRGVLVEASAVQLIDEVHVAGLVELDALVRRPRITFRCTKSALMLLVGVSGSRIAGASIGFVELEQAAIRAAGASGGVIAPALLRRDERPPRCPERGIESNVAARRQALPDRVRLTREQVDALHARLPGFEHSEEEAALVSARLIDGVHVPGAGIGLTGRQLRRSARDGLLLEGRIAERDRRRLVGRRAGRARSGVKSEKRVPSATRAVPASRRPAAVTILERPNDILISIASSLGQLRCKSVTRSGRREPANNL